MRIESVRYIKTVDEGMHSYDWGGDPTCWMEIDAGGHAERQIEQYPNGTVISYDSSYPGDEHGALSLMVIDGDEMWWEPYFISQEEFEQVWREHRPINREFPPDRVIQQGDVMAKRKPKPVGPIYQLKVTLKRTKPPIWRRIQVPAGITLADLHDILQITMGWENDHLHEFSIGGQSYEAPMEAFDFSLLFVDDSGAMTHPPELDLPVEPPIEPWEDDLGDDDEPIELWEDDLDDDDEPQDERDVLLQDVMQTVKQKMRYLYDFGDGWDHDVVLEKILEPDPAGVYPICLAGKLACPPEDIGGVWGYAALLEAQADPSHPRHEEFQEWFGEPIDPERFDLVGVNRRLKSLRGR